MRTLPAATAASALALGLLLSGCGATATEKKADSSAATTTLAVPDRPAGPHKTIADYVSENKIIEAPVKKGDPGSPTFSFPMPPDWRAAGPQKPDWAYGAIVYTKAQNPADPPFVTAILSKLTGDVDAAKVLEYAPGMLQNLPGYRQDGDLIKGSVSGFESVAFQGSYLKDGTEKRYIAQKTVVIPGQDKALFVLQLNADAPDGQGDVIREANKIITSGTTITP